MICIMIFNAFGAQGLHTGHGGTKVNEGFPSVLVTAIVDKFCRHVRATHFTTSHNLLIFKLNECL